MSQEDELLELSTMYHGTREYVEELEHGMADCNKKIAALEALLRDASNLLEKYHGTIEIMYGLPFAVRAPILPMIDAWQQRANELLSKPFQEPLEGISGI